MKKVNCRFPLMLFLLGIIFTGCSDSINTMLEEYNGNFTVEITEYTAPCPGDTDFDEANMLFDEYIVASDDTLTLAAPKKCNIYKWILQDPASNNEEVTPVLFGGGSNNERIYSIYIGESGLKSGKTYRLLLAVYGEATKQWHYDVAAIVVYERISTKVTENDRSN